MNKLSALMIKLTLFLCIFSSYAFAQDSESSSSAENSLKEIFFGSFIGGFIWVLILIASIATLGFIINSLITVKKNKIIPPSLVTGVRSSLEEGDLDSAISACENNPSPLSKILQVGFSNITEGYDVIRESISAAAEMENEIVMQKVNYLNMLGQIAPMLGLLGTVTGMVEAFGALSGSAQSKMATLAVAISKALWTTAAGLLISVPALISYTLIKNHATRIILESEAQVIDLIKTLRDAEISEEEEYE